MDNAKKQSRYDAFGATHSRRRPRSETEKKAVTRSAIISSTLRRLKEKRKYQRTQVAMISGSKWRPRKIAGRLRVIASKRSACILIGLGICLASLTPLVDIPLFVWSITRRFIVPEEEALAEQFGQAYKAYQTRVRRWL
jgi:hypothetical protein